MAEIREFSTGCCSHPEFIALKNGKLRVRKFPAKVWLICLQNKKWLFDTGYSAHFIKATDRGWGWLYRKVTPVSYSLGDSIAEQLAAEGITIDGVILSHFHGDHIGGLKDFNIPVVCSSDGWSDVRKLKKFAALRKAFVPELIPDRFQDRLIFMENLRPTTLAPELFPFEKGYELPGSEGALMLVRLPGHAVGHIGAFVHTDNGWVLLAADAAWSAQSYRDNLKPTFIASRFMASHRDYMDTINKLHTLWKNKAVEIKLCHDGE